MPVVAQYRLRQALVRPGGLVNIWKLASESSLEPDSRRRAGEGNGACHKLNARPRGTTLENPTSTASREAGTVQPVQSL